MIETLMATVRIAPTAWTATALPTVVGWAPAVLLAAVASTAAAQATAPAPGAGPVGRHACEQPEYPGRLASDNQIRGFNKRHQAYAECMKKYIAEQQKIIEEHQRVAKAHADAASAAIDEYNKYVETVNAQMGSK